MRLLKQSATANVMVFMTDSADHVSGKASLTLTITASKDGGAFASISPTVTERGSGWYSLALTASHTDTLGDLALHVTGSGADPSDLACRVVAGALDADVSSRLAAAGYTAPDNATIATIQADTNDLQTRLPAALVGGRIDASVGAMAAGVVTAAAVATDAIDGDAIAASAVTELQAGLALSSQVDALEGDTATLLARLTSGRASNLDNLDATISSRLAAAAYTAPDNAGITTIIAYVDELESRLTSTRAALLDNLDAAVSSRAATGADMGLTAGAVDAIWDEVLELTHTARQLMRLLASAAGGKASGLDSNLPRYRDLADTKNRIAATTDANGNRSAVTLDLN